MTQHSQRALPALARGDNRVRLRGGSDEGTITIEGACGGQDAAKRQPTLAAFGLVGDGVSPDFLAPTGGAGSFELPIATPGDLKRLRISACYRARDAKDGYRVQVVLGDGDPREIGAFGEPTPCTSSAITCDDPPAGCRSAKLRFVARQVNSAMLIALRVDADYREPHAGFRPVRVTYRWDEAGVAKSDVHVARAPDEAWTIRCEGEPRMRSIAYELAP